jgi:hypothetical protein
MTITDAAIEKLADLEEQSSAINEEIEVCRELVRQGRIIQLDIELGDHGLIHDTKVALTERFFFWLNDYDITYLPHWHEHEFAYIYGMDRRVGARDIEFPSGVYVDITFDLDSQRREDHLRLDYGFVRLMRIEYLKLEAKKEAS